MNFFSSKQKVYTTDSAAINPSEDVGVEGKRYPTHALGRVIARFPLLMFLTFLLPFAFFIVGCVKIQSSLSYSLDDYQIRSTVAVRRDALKINSVLNDWATALSGTSVLADNVDLSHDRSIVKDMVELRAVVDLTALNRFAIENNVDNVTRDNYGNLISSDLYRTYKAVEIFITHQDGYEDVCFTNNLRYGVWNSEYPACAPVSSVSQYLYPVWDGLEWNMTGTGSTLQLDYLPRLFSNPSYGWFFDDNFSSTNVVARQLRSQFTFATSRDQPREFYLANMKRFLPKMMTYVNTGQVVEVAFISYSLGGGTSQNLLMEIAGEAEGYKVGLAAVICFVLSWWHCTTFVMGLYTVAQTMVVYMAAAGLYGVIYGSLPLATYPAIVWVTTFCMHGTLSFYDMFVYSGVMATKGRQNNLSVAQRLCFTMRRVSTGVWIADVLAIIIFAINTTSLFSSVGQFSVFMMIALLWNMYCVALSTPALVVLHHMRFANKRRNLQKQSDVLNAAMQQCRRSSHLVSVLETVVTNTADGEFTYWRKMDGMQKRISIAQGVNTKQFANTGNFVRAQITAGADQVKSARKDIVGALHKVRKTKRQVMDGEDTADVEMPAIQLQDFLQVGDANPLANDAAAADDGVSRYYNPRMVLPSDLLHIPPTYVERNEHCWARICEALHQPTQDEHGGIIPPRVYSLKSQGTSETEAAAFAERWRCVGTSLEVQSTPQNRSPSFVPLAVRNVVRSHDSAMVITSFHATAQSQYTLAGRSGLGTAYAQTTKPTGGPSGFGLAKLRYRWSHRAEMRRTGCCGLFGRVADETPEERMSRLMRRKVKRDGYSLFERFLLNYYVPVMYRGRYVLLVLLVALFVALCIAGSFATAGGLPNTLIVGQEAAADRFAAMEDTFGQRGNCTFCAPYYRSVQDYRQATAPDIAVCAPTYQDQMNLYRDSCGVCNGTDACVDCEGAVNGNAVLDACGGCSVDSSSASAGACVCSETRNCSYCEWAAADGFIAETCAAVCADANQCGDHGTCDQYTAACVCDPGYSGAACTVASLDCGAHGSLNSVTGVCACDADWSGAACTVSSACGLRGALLSAADSPTGEEMCGCVGHWRGATCQVCDCANGGMCDDETGACVCTGAFVGPRCETCAASCTARGTCPDVAAPDYDLWSVRACIAAACVEQDATTGLKSFTETLCSACERTGLTDTVTVCSATLDETSCLLNSECWWYAPAGASAYCGLARVSNDTSSLECTCTFPAVWSGETCGTCLAPSGASCEDDGTVRGCNGLMYTSASAAMSTDVCGVCGGNGLCRGCDGIPGSGKVYDSCGVCGGDGSCTGATTADHVYVDYLFDLTDVATVVNNSDWCKLVTMVTTQLRLSEGSASQSKSVIEDYLGNRADYYVSSLGDLYNYAKANGRLGEVVFALDYSMEPVSLLYIRYRMQSAWVDSESSASLCVQYYYWIEKYLIGPFRTSAAASNVTLSYTSAVFQPALAKVGALQSLWFAVGIGLAVAFVALLVYYVSVTTAAAATMVAAVGCFGSLTVCKMFGWEVDAVLQVCVSCTVPISVEYVVHFCSGYFDYLQTTTSHLFARDVTRRTAVQGALLRSMPAVCTSAVAVILVAVMFDVSTLTPLRRCGQIAITLHLLILIAGVTLTGAMAALGPMKAYQHWTLSALLCVVCAVLAGVSVLIIYGANGVEGPHAKKILTH